MKVDFLFSAHAASSRICDTSVHVPDGLPDRAPPVVAQVANHSLPNRDADPTSSSAHTAGSSCTTTYEGLREDDSGPEINIEQYFASKRRTKRKPNPPVALHPNDSDRTMRSHRDKENRTSIPILSSRSQSPYGALESLFETPPQNIVTDGASQSDAAGLLSASHRHSKRERYSWHIPEVVELRCEDDEEHGNSFLFD